MIEEIVTRKESTNLKEEIKKIEKIIAKNKNQIKMLKKEKQEWEKEKNKYFAEIKILDKKIKIDEIYQIKKQIQKNKKEIAKLEEILPNKPLKKTYMIKLENEIKKLNEGITDEISKEKKIDNEIRIMEITGANLEQQMESVNENDLNETLILSKLKLKTTKLLVKLERRTYKTRKIFARIGENKLAIANNYLLIKQKTRQLYPNIRTEKEILNARLKIKLRDKINKMCNLNLDISKKNLIIAKINKKIAYLDLNINKKDIEVKNYLATIRQIYNSQNVKLQIKSWLKAPFIWLNKHFQKYKYKMTLNQYQTQLEKLEKEIIKLETDKLTGNFYNKFWLIISCGFFDSRQKHEIREEKKAKLYEIKRKIHQLKNQTNIQSQLPTSRHGVSWNETVGPNSCFNEARYHSDKNFTSSF